MDFPSISIKDLREPPERKYLTKEDLQLKINEYIQTRLYDPLTETVLSHIRTWCTYIIMDQEKYGNIEYNKYMFVCEGFPRVNRVEWCIIDLWKREKEEKEWNEFIEQRRIEWNANGYGEIQ